ncbi:MAG: NAD(P)H-hydrate dehydratase [Methylococcaceae bacterium]
MNPITEPTLPSSLFTAAAVREMDRHALDFMGISGLELMQRAGQFTFDCIRDTYPEARTLSVLTGAGHNGGDGYVIARLAHQAGWDVRVYPATSPEALNGDAATVMQQYRDGGGSIAQFIPEHFEGAEILVDAVLGTGINRPVEGFYADLIQATQRFRGKIVSVDVPSGLHADTGAVMGVAVKADLTVTFVGLKQGLFTGQGLEQCGTVRFSDLDIPPAVAQHCTRSARLLPRLTQGLPPRRRHTHKGDFGHVLVVGGAEGYSGAARLAAEAAARVGAGLVSVATHPANAPLLNLGCPELMCHGIRNAECLTPLLRHATVVVLGPGLRLSDWAYSLWEQVLRSQLPVVLDADGLNFLSGHTAHRDNWVLTPHPGEAARLLGMASPDIQRNRYAAIRELQHTYGGVVVLKGSGTLILGPDDIPAVCTAGNPGMASGGMGDVLSGVIAALIAQDLSLDHAAELGVRLHAAAGDTAAEAGERGLMARDLLNPLRYWVNA